MYFSISYWIWHKTDTNEIRGVYCKCKNYDIHDFFLMILAHASLHWKLDPVPIVALHSSSSLYEYKISGLHDIHEVTCTVWYMQFTFSVIITLRIFTILSTFIIESAFLIIHWMVCNNNWTDWSTIQGVITWISSKSDSAKPKAILKLWARLLPELGNCEKELPKKPVGRLSVNCRPSVGRLSAVCQPTVGRLSAICWLSIGRLSAICRPTDGQQVFPKT